MERDPLDVLLIEDDRDDYFIVRRLLQKAHTIACDLTWASSYAEGREALRTGAFDVALVDYRLGERTGLDLLEETAAQQGRPPLILLTGQGGPQIDLRAMQGGAADYLTKAGLDAEILERALRYARERARSGHEIHRQAALLDETRDAICAYDLDGKITYWNDGAARMTGYERSDVGDLTSADCLCGADRGTVECAWDTVQTKGEWAGELNQTTRSGDPLIVKSRWTLVRDAAGAPAAVLVINTDVTERKRLERQALRSQRMESIGRLVGGIAHDLGNLLVPILLGVSVLRERHGGTERTERTLRMIEKSAERGSDMVDRVLAFARGVEGERRPLDLAEIAEEVEQLVEESFPAGITFEASLPSALPPVRGDATQLQQVLVNLSVNARDAMPDGGRLSLDARAVDLAEGDRRLVPTAAPGRYVHVCVQDTGDGIPPDVLDKVFEPFFSTKPSDDGTGLGLSTVYSIIDSHGGFVDVQSEMGEGTSFDLFLPVSEEPAEEAAEEPPAGDASRDGRAEQVLVVDDEAFVRESAGAVLDDCGYRPLAAAGLKEALRLLEEHPVEVVLTDVALTSENGLDAVRAFKKRRPDVPVVVCSGRADSQVKEARAAGADHFLAKPFSREALRGVLDAVLPTPKDAA
jgi:PAS domain S-box-containing protein